MSVVHDPASDNRRKAGARADTQHVYIQAEQSGIAQLVCTGGREHLDPRGFQGSRGTAGSRARACEGGKEKSERPQQPKDERYTRRSHRLLGSGGVKEKHKRHERQSAGGHTKPCELRSHKGGHRLAGRGIGGTPVCPTKWRGAEHKAQRERRRKAEGSGSTRAEWIKIRERLYRHGTRRRRRNRRRERAVDAGAAAADEGAHAKRERTERTRSQQAV
eukprot:scaffold108832_cov35-Tisochrysis_lutea.AAC.3